MKRPCIGCIDWPYDSKRYSLCIVDDVTKERIPITDFIGAIKEI